MLQVDKAKCIKCGICADVCPRCLVSIESDGPEVLEPGACIGCGQCVAVCPRSALDNIRSSLAQQIPLSDFSGIDEKTAHYYLRARRSIRCYKKEAVSREKLLKLLDIARFAPTGGNSQGLSYAVFERPEILKKIPPVVIDWVEEQARTGSKWCLDSDELYLKNYRSGRDVVLREAPCLILATAPKDFKRGGINTHFSFAYVELYAPSLGLGSCYAGLIGRCISAGHKPLLDLLNLPEDKSVTGALMVGYPKYKYKRLVDRNPLNVIFDVPKAESTE